MRKDCHLLAAGPFTQLSSIHNALSLTKLERMSSDTWIHYLFLDHHLLGPFRFKGQHKSGNGHNVINWVKPKAKISQFRPETIELTSTIGLLPSRPFTDLIPPRGHPQPPPSMITSYRLLTVTPSIVTAFRHESIEEPYPCIQFTHLEPKGIADCSLTLPLLDTG